MATLEWIDRAIDAIPEPYELPGESRLVILATGEVNFAPSAQCLRDCRTAHEFEQAMMDQSPVVTSVPHSD